MRYIFLLPFLALSCFGQASFINASVNNGSFGIVPIPVVITNNLLVDLQAGVGETLDPSGMYVTNWADQSGNGNNAIQQATNLAFLHWTNYLGYPCLRSYGNNLNHFTNFMTVGAGLSLNSQQVTVYVVSTGPKERGAADLIAFGGAYTNFDFLAFFEGTTYQSPLVMVAPQWNTTTTFPAQNLAVFCSENSTTNAVLRWNNIEETHSQSGSGTLNYMIIGGSGTSANHLWGGDIVRVLVYGTLAHTPEQRVTNTAALTVQHHLVTNFNNMVMCRGDSTTEGYLITNLMTWPWQCMEAKPNIQWYQYGSGSARIQTNGIGAGNNTLYGDDPTFLDPVFTSAVATNWLFVMAGVNDLNVDTQSGQNVYGRLTNACAARLAAHNWKIVVTTIANNTSSATQDTNYCNAIRTQSQAYWFGVNDVGAGSGHGLDDFNNSNFLDGLHLSASGYTIIKNGFLTFLP